MNPTVENDNTDTKETERGGSVAKNSD